MKILKKITKSLFVFAFLFVFSFLLNQEVFAASCTQFQATVNANLVTLQASGCDTSGYYNALIVKDGEQILGDRFFVDNGIGQVSFNIAQEGDYSAVLIWTMDVLRETTFSITGETPLSCGDQCNPNDLNCPTSCPSRICGSRWYCLNPSASCPIPPTPIPRPTSAPIPGSPDAEPIKLGESLQLGNNETLAEVYDTPGKIVNIVVKNLFIFAGVILFALIIMAGLSYIKDTEKGKEEAKNLITGAIVGLIVIFSAYWVVQIIKFITGVEIPI